MARSDRDRFNDHVAVLVRVLGFDLDDLADAQRQKLLGDAWQARMNPHEAALAVGLGRFHRVLEQDLERARVLLDRLGLVSAHWTREALVKPSVVEPLARQARASLRDAGA